MKELIIMFGPPGSGKTSGLDRFLEIGNVVVPRRASIVHLCVDDFVYGSKEYARDLKKMDVGQGSKKGPMRDLYMAHFEKGQDEFEGAIDDNLSRGTTPLAFDVTGHNLSRLERFVKGIKKKRYRIHVVYPYVNCISELMDRLFARFNDPTSRQTPAPKQLVNAILEGAPRHLNELVVLFKTSIKSFTVIDNSSRKSAHFNQVLFQFKDDACQFFSLKFEPCHLVGVSPPRPPTVVVSPRTHPQRSI